MAKWIKAIQALCPRIRLAQAASPEFFMRMITLRTTLSSGVVKNVQDSEVETLIGMLLGGQPVHTGTAIYTPSVDLNGNININVKVDARLKRAVNTPGAFHGSIDHAELIGQSSDELVQLWNLDHPDDPVT